MGPQAYREWSPDEEEGRQVPTTDEEGWRWVRERGFGTDLKQRGLHGHTVWHSAGECGIGANMCRWLKAQGGA
eukprot:CAMPEP_0182573054 /NCGR_PEP_ID=MMETSP1324-20130603/18040_1 /TAXON_ID=236786 /ORGANISM="Florenciella sp., Strain RCC1587" /LENGTH=72 /DNA_ID=CAMNT_0024788095 /DNA_START=101 /DNA_END=315 /DNA_ORIENTATION=+